VPGAYVRRERQVRHAGRHVQLQAQAPEQERGREALGRALHAHTLSNQRSIQSKPTGTRYLQTLDVEARVAERQLRRRDLHAGARSVLLQRQQDLARALAAREDPRREGDGRAAIGFDAGLDAQLLQVASGSQLQLGHGVVGDHDLVGLDGEAESRVVQGPVRRGAQRCAVE
jgi:hypothetical protein